MNESFPRLSQSLSSRVTFYLLRIRRSGETTTTKGKGKVTEKIFFLVRFEMTGLLGCTDVERLESWRREEGGNEQERRSESWSDVPWDALGKKEHAYSGEQSWDEGREEERGVGKRRWTEEKEDVDTIQWRLQVFPVFPRGGRRNNWGRKGIDPGEERQESVTSAPERNGNGSRVLGVFAAGVFTPRKRKAILNDSDPNRINSAVMKSQ